MAELTIYLMCLVLCINGSHCSLKACIRLLNMKLSIFLTSVLDGHEKILLFRHYPSDIYTEEDNWII
jgi:hypothetical protein